MLNDFPRGSIDVLVGGPPCQGFSIAGKKMLDDPRNTFYKIDIDLIKHSSPSIIVLESW